MQRLRWLRLNRTGIAKLPAEISTLKKLVRACKFKNDYFL
jgi:hypothetical protein